MSLVQVKHALGVYKNAYRSFFYRNLVCLDISIFKQTHVLFYWMYVNLHTTDVVTIFMVLPALDAIHSCIFHSRRTICFPHSHITCKVHTYTIYVFICLSNIERNASSRFFRKCNVFPNYLFIKVGVILAYVVEQGW